MATESTRIYSIGSLTGPLPFAQVIRTLLRVVQDKVAQRATSKDPGMAHLEEVAVGHDLANTAEYWTQKRIEYLDAVKGAIDHKDTRLFDYDLLQAMKKVRSYEDVINFLNACNDQDVFRFERE